MKSRSRASTPSTVKRTVPPGRLPNAQYRTREYLTEREVERLRKAAGNNRHGHRDATMILMAFQHGPAPPRWGAGDVERYRDDRPLTARQLNRRRPFDHRFDARC